MVGLLARLLLGGLFIYMGLSKALHAVEFLKLVRQYDLVSHHLVLNAIAAFLPWFEVICGLLLIFGVAVRGAALICLAMLIPFTLAVFDRAWDIHTVQGLAFCAIKFDCGCGGGEVLICRKLVENALLIAMSVWLFLVPARRFAVRYALLRLPNEDGGVGGQAVVIDKARGDSR